jgi:hypothetical protein
MKVMSEKPESCKKIQQPIDLIDLSVVAEPLLGQVVRPHRYTQVCSSPSFRQGLPESVRP